MKWPVLGIITIVFLQLGYTAFNSVDRSMQSLVMVDPLPTGNAPVEGPIARWISSDRDPFARTETDDAFTAAAPRKSVRESEPILVAENRRPEQDKGQPRSQLVAMNRPFETVTITYQRPSKPGGESENYQPATYSATSTENRSFLSKSVAVIKRPYKWLKTLGSKID